MRYIDTSICAVLECYQVKGNTTQTSKRRNDEGSKPLRHKAIRKLIDHKTNTGVSDD